LDHCKNTILQNFDAKRFDYFLKLIFFKLPLGKKRLRGNPEEGIKFPLSFGVLIGGINLKKNGVRPSK